MLQLQNIKKGDKFKTRRGDVVTFLKTWVRGHLVFTYPTGEWLLTTSYGNALHLNNDIIAKL